jgi:hypothetical protein
MKTYSVWYMRPEWFREGICGAYPDPTDLNKTHVHLLDREAPDLERLWVGMQGERWSPNGEARGLIKSKGLQHTSMSVGDVAVDGDRVHVVASMGFTDITPWAAELSAIRARDPRRK